MVMCIHSQEIETCRFGCTFRSAKELRLEKDKLLAENSHLKSALRVAETFLRVHKGTNEILKQIKFLKKGTKQYIAQADKQA